MKGKLQCFGMIGLSNVGAVGKLCMHGYLPFGIDDHSKNKSGKCSYSTSFQIRCGCLK